MTESEINELNTTYFTPKADVSSTASKRKKRSKTTEWKAPLSASLEAITGVATYL